MYHDIAEQLIQDILAGKYPVKLPTEQVLMNRYQAATLFVRRWMSFLPTDSCAECRAVATTSLIIRSNQAPS